MATPGSAPSRRTLTITAVVLFAAVLIGVIAVTAAYDQSPSAKAPDSIEIDRRPTSIERPNQGRAPEDKGDPGGWEQLALFGLLAVAMIGIGVAVFRGGRTAQANRAAWRAAAEPGREEDRRRHEADRLAALHHREPVDH